MSKQIEEGIIKTLTAPLRRKKLIKKVEASADKHREHRDGSNEVARQATETARAVKQHAKKINYFDPEHARAHEVSKDISKMADAAFDRAGKSAKMAAKRSGTALKLFQGRKSKALGANKDLKEENMEPISTGIKALQEKNLEEMRSNFNEALARKAAEALQEKKLEIASSYFGK